MSVKSVICAWHMDSDYVEGGVDYEICHFHLDFFIATTVYHVPTYVFMPIVVVIDLGKISEGLYRLSLD